MRQFCASGPYYSQLQVAAVKAKIGKVAAYYDPARIRLDGFNSAELDPTALKEQLRRNFDIKLTPAELGAIMVMFDKDGNGTISCAEFLHEFFKIGRATKDTANRLNVAAKEDRKKKKEERIMKRKEKYAQLAIIPRVNYSPEDLMAAKAKLEKIAEYWDKNRQGSLNDFVYGDEMSPTIFREQLRRNFNLMLSPAELFALFDDFDLDSSGRVDGTEFLVQFFRVGRAKKLETLQKRIQYEQRMEKERVEFRAQVKERYAKLAECKTSEVFTDADYTMALDKIKTVARSYHGGEAAARGAGGLSGFADAAAMDATLLREQLKQLFNLRFSSPELSALIDHFDKDGDVRVDGAEFLSEFQRLSQDEKSKNLRKHQAMAEKIRKQKQDVIDRHTAKFCKKVEANIIYPKIGNTGKLDRESINSMTAEELGYEESVSEGTVDFLKQLEKGEKKIKRMGESRRRGSKKKDASARSSMGRSQETPGLDEGASLES